MIDNDETITDETFAFAEQWAKLWATATAALQSVGWENDKHGAFYWDLWEAPEGWTRAAWAASLATVEAQDAKAFADAKGNEFVSDAAFTLLSLAYVLESVAAATVDRNAVRAASLWSLNASTYFLRRHSRLPAMQDALAARRQAEEAAAHMREAQALLAPRLSVAEKQADAAEETAAKRRDKWHPQGKAIAREILAADPYANDTAIVEEILSRAGDGFEVRSERQIRRALAFWRAQPTDSIPPRLERP